MKLPMMIAVRGYAVPVHRRAKKKKKRRPTRKVLPHPSHEALIFDCETTNDHAQSLRFGTYQCRKRGKLVDHGIFYEPFNKAALSARDLTVIRSYAEKRGLTVRTRADFVDRVFYKYAYAYGAVVVGFNLPFDLSRLATDITTSQAHDMRNAFSLTLSEHKNNPNVLVRHLNARASFIRFAAFGSPDARSSLKRGEKSEYRSGYFLDTKTLAAALLGKGHTLKSLADVLETPHRKLEAKRHGGPVTKRYLDYAMTDTQVTYECFEALSAMYKRHGLKTPAHRIYSEASLGKAYLNEMNIAPLKKVQPDVPPEILGQIMGTYYGGRSEVRVRRQVTRVLYCDFRSMYPTVCTLMGLWRFVISTGFDWSDWTNEARELLAKIELPDLQDPATWQAMPVLVQIMPEDDILPVRAAYGGTSRTIGLNRLSAKFPMWFSLADCIASKLLSGRTPRIIRATRFAPRAMQEGLRPIRLGGDDNFVIDPAQDDFYRDLILMRGRIQSALKSSSNSIRREILFAQQMTLKLVANSTSYGIFAEQNVEFQDSPCPLRLFGQDEIFRTTSRSVEEPGTHFHPLIATLITGAARLMLACAERVASENRLGWAFCDTDSLALARPEGMDDGEFLNRCESVTGWFDRLDPYADGKPLFKVEEQNFRLKHAKATDRHEPLYAIAISAKRYVLFNLDGNGRPIIRKAVAHGLGHLMEPYREDEAPTNIPRPQQGLEALELKRWQYDLWYRIALAFLEGHPDRVDLDDLPGLNRPARSRYGANTAALRNWFRKFNKGKRLSDQVKCFNFLVAYQVSKTRIAEQMARGGLDNELIEDGLPAVVAPYSDNPKTSASNCFDRRTGKPVPVSILKTYREAISEYAWHSESKFENGSETACGVTERRHVETVALEYIGKEANRWEEQFYLGEMPEAQIEYRMSKRSLAGVIVFLRDAADRRLGRSAVALAAGVSRQQLTDILDNDAVPRMRTLRALMRGVLSIGCLGDGTG